MQADRDEQGNLRFANLPTFFAETLLHLPEWLRDDDREVRERLGPPVYEDPEEEEQWQRLAGPDLEHLYLSQAEIVEKDLEELTATLPGPAFSLEIPKGHEAAWLSALNGARMTIFVKHGFSPSDLELDPAEVTDPAREVALVQIHIMGLFQELMLSAGAL